VSQVCYIIMPGAWNFHVSVFTAYLMDGTHCCSLEDFCHIFVGELVI